MYKNAIKTTELNFKNSAPDVNNTSESDIYEHITSHDDTIEDLNDSSSLQVSGPNIEPEQQDELNDEESL